MHIILIDSDLNYLTSIQSALLKFSKYEDTVSFYITAESMAEALNILKLPLPKDAVLLVDENFIFENDLLYTYQSVACNIPILLLFDGLITKEAKEKISLTLGDIDELENIYINRYQCIEDFYTKIKSSYLTRATCSGIFSNKGTNVISIFTPYGDSKSSAWIESYLTQNSRQSTLLIHYDPYFLGLEKDQFNLSYLFQQLDKESNQLSFLLDQIVRKVSGQLHVVDGPMHMFDLNFLTDKMYAHYIQWLQGETTYKRIIINFNGVHMTKHIDGLLAISKQCALISRDEGIQVSITRQLAHKWYIVTVDEEHLLKEVLQ